MVSVLWQKIWMKVAQNSHRCRLDLVTPKVNTRCALKIHVGASYKVGGQLSCLPMPWLTRIQKEGWRNWLGHSAARASTKMPNYGTTTSTADKNRRGPMPWLAGIQKEGLVKLNRLLYSACQHQICWIRVAAQFTTTDRVQTGIGVLKYIYKREPMPRPTWIQKEGWWNWTDYFFFGAWPSVWSIYIVLD